MRRHHGWRSIALLIAFLGLHTARAEEREQALGTVVVTATRTEQPVAQANTPTSVITAAETESRHADTILEPLRSVPGVDVSQSGSPGTLTSVFIRGADADQTLVLIDGVEANSPTLGDFNFGSLNPDNVERIEVLRGAGGTLYGSEAVGGVINVLTKRGAGPPQFSLLNEGGNGAAQLHRFSLAGAQVLLGFSGSVSYQSVGGFRPVNDDYNNLTASMRLDADLIEHGTLRGFFRYEDATVGLVNNLNFFRRPGPEWG